MHSKNTLCSLLLVGALFCALAQADRGCEENFKRLSNHNFVLNLWKAPVINWIWRAEIAEGQFPYRERYQINERGLSDYYLPSLFYQSVDALRAIRESDKPIGYRFGVQPAKFLASSLVLNFWGHAGLALSLGGSGLIFDALGINDSDPIQMESDSGPDTKPSEIIVFIKMHSTLNEEDTLMWQEEMKQVKELVHAYPESYRILDLSKDAGISSPEAAKARLGEFEAALPDPVRIRRFIPMGHGSTARIESDFLPRFEPENILNVAEVFTPLKKRFTERTEIFPDSCHLADSQAGREKLDEFARRLLPPGGKLRANTISGYANGATNYKGLLRSRSRTKLLATPFFLVNPFFGELFHSSVTTLAIQVERRKEIQNTEFKEHARYEYTVP